ncbi:MAG: Gfo/Idh/MocA family oxidoreductase [Spirochaetota bacterium]
MKTIGFIDYFLDEWHANNYPQWIRESAVSGWGVKYGYAMQDAPAPGLTTDAWCAKFGVTKCSSMEEIIDRSDALIVLSPNNPEQHEALCKLPLASGKPVYVDKTFAPDLAAAKRIFAMAEAGRTPMFSSSALRYATEVDEIKTKVPRADLNFVATRGGGKFEIYIIHQLEMIVSLLGPDAKRVMSVGVPEAPSLVIDYGKARATATMVPGGFGLAAQYDADKGTVFGDVKSVFFVNLIATMLRFFEDRKIPVAKEETLAIMALIDAGKKAVAKPDTWIATER